MAKLLTDIITLDPNNLELDEKKAEAYLADLKKKIKI